MTIHGQVLAADKELLPPEHPDGATTSLGIAAALTDKGLYDEAEVHARRGYEIRREVLPANRVDTAKAAVILAQSLAKEGKLAESETLLIWAYPILKERLGAGAEHTQLALRVLVEVYQCLGLDLKADAYRQLLIGKSHP